LPATTGVKDDEVGLRCSVDKSNTRVRLPMTHRLPDITFHLIYSQTDHIH